MTRTLRIGTRGSELALVQARWVAARLAEHGIATELQIIRTEGDERPVDTGWGEGAFVARIVAALVDARVDLAVHSAKDVPTTEPDLLVIAAYPPREDPRDALVCRVRGTTLATLPHGHELVVAVSGAVADATRFVALLGAAFIAVGLVGTMLLPRSTGMSGQDGAADAPPAARPPGEVPGKRCLNSATS